MLDTDYKPGFLPPGADTDFLAYLAGRWLATAEDDHAAASAKGARDGAYLRGQAEAHETCARQLLAALCGVAK